MFCKPCDPSLTAPTYTSVDHARVFLRKEQGIVVDLTLAQARPLMGRAFGGETADKCSTAFAYMLQGLGQLSDKDRQELVGFFLGFLAFETIQKGGLIFGVPNTADGSLDACVVLREYDPAKENRHPTFLDKMWETISNIRAYLSMKFDSVGMPELFQKNPAVKKVVQEVFQDVEPMGDMLHDWHCHHAPQEKHWYVAIVATNPGKGHGRRVMELLGQAADQIGLNCYLECPEYNRIFYEKVGYTVTKEVTMSLENKDRGNVSAPMLLMTRHPNIS